jgi:hypothetical protein
MTDSIGDSDEFDIPRKPRFIEVIANVSPGFLANSFRPTLKVMAVDV